MGTSLGKMVARLMDQAPARNGYPTLTQYEEIVLDALADFGRRAGVVKTAILAITAGQARYTLPADFVRVIRLSGLGVTGGVAITNAGLVPVSQGFEERLTVAGRTLTISPTPEYGTNRELVYQAGYAVVDEDVHDLERERAGVVLLKAQAICLTEQANHAVHEAWQYQMGDQRISKERLAAEMREQAKALENQYLASVEGLAGLAGSRAGGWA